jgi:hypothetical protein
MTSDANEFEESFDSMEEFVDGDGRHFSVIYFDDGSGLVFRK